ncbi:MAG: hypothetical protein ACUVUG_01155 [Candidatus Aminicenantia bacterium]
MKKILSKIVKAYKEGGVSLVIFKGIRFLFNLLGGRYILNALTSFFYEHFSDSKKFKFQNQKYYYFHHPYNTGGERTVEVPIIWKVVNEYKASGKSILEVGNVLSHYFPISHTVVDKYEPGKVVINEDIVTYNPSQKYDLIVSISTLEHVGWDEEPKEPEKILRAIERLKNILATNGKLIVTLPLGYNSEMDKYLREGKIGFPRVYLMKRVTKSNKWVEKRYKGVPEVEYGKPFPFANAILICVFEND